MGNQKEQNTTQKTLEDEFIEGCLDLGELLEEKYTINMASNVSPIDIVQIGLSVYANDQITTHIPRDAATAVKPIDPQYFIQLGRTKEDFATRYQELVGKTSYADGEIAHFLETPPRWVSQEDADNLRKRFAILLAFQIAIEPNSITSVPGVRLTKDATGAEIKGRNDETLFQLPKRPSLVIEYGPGIAAYRKIPDEVRQTPQTIMIDNNKYVNEVLLARARLAGLNQDPARPQLLALTNGIKSGSDLLVAQGKRADLIIASMIQTASEEEIQAGFQNANNLLRPSGVFVLQAVRDVSPHIVPGERMLAIAQQSFGKTPDLETNFRMRTVPGQSECFNVIFQKA